MLEPRGADAPPHAVEEHRTRYGNALINIVIPSAVEGPAFICRTDRSRALLLSLVILSEDCSLRAKRKEQPQRRTYALPTAPRTPQGVLPACRDGPSPVRRQAVPGHQALTLLLMSLKSNSGFDAPTSDALSTEYRVLSTEYCQVALPCPPPPPSCPLHSPRPCTKDARDGSNRLRILGSADTDLEWFCSGFGSHSGHPLIDGFPQRSSAMLIVHIS